MSTYLKHMGGYIFKQLKGKSFDEIQKLFDKEIKRVNTFVAMGSEVQESKEKKEEGREETAKGSRKKMLRRKRAGKEQQKESSKKQKVEEEKESEEVDEVDEAELKKLLVIKKDEDIAIDAINHLLTQIPFQEIFFNDKDATWNRQRRLGSSLEDSEGKVWFGINKRYQSFALRNFDLEDMKLESTNSSPTAKLHILKLVLQTTQENSITVTKMSTPATAEEKTNKKNNVKAKGLLLMALPNENQLTFSQYPDAKSMFAAIETRFGGNAATKKTQKTLLKQ
ncbi:hypothetical protein Tco_1073777 [Tanacetum coccineum]